MDAWVLVGSAAAVAIIVLACLGPKHWKHPSKWKIPDIGAGFFVFVGANSVTEAAKIARQLVLGHLKLVTGHKAGAPVFSGVGGEDWVFFLGGVFAGLTVGVISIRDGVKKIRD